MACRVVCVCAIVDVPIDVFCPSLCFLYPGGKSWVDTTQTLVHVDHYHLLAGVCIDYCVAINRTDLLFGHIFDEFQREKRLTVLLELLEPYILNDKLHYLTPVVMQAFVEHYETTGQIASVERCILHMDTT